MTTKLHTESAKIYQFPEGGRAATRGHRERNRPVAVNAIPVRAARIVVGKNWYHDEAIQDDVEDPDKH